MNRFFFSTMLFIVICFGGLSLVSIHADAALARHSGYANDWQALQGDELPNTYGDVAVENMWVGGPWAYSTHFLLVTMLAVPLDLKTLTLISPMSVRFGGQTV